jgi:Flp pilus assembly pilin Flp
LHGAPWRFPILPSSLDSRWAPPRTTLERHFLCELWLKGDGQDIAEYAVMLAVILVPVVDTARLVGSNANAAFSSVASSL